MIDTSSGTVMGTVSSMANKTSNLWGLFLDAELFVQIIMVLLAVASFWSWTIIFAKYKTFKVLSKETLRFEELVWSGKSLEKVSGMLGEKESNPMAKIFLAATEEWKHAGLRKGEGHMELKLALLQRIERVMDVILRQEMEKLESNSGFLANVSSAAPFIGLLGTVWGIMHSFQAIAISKNTSLNVVAPGIAEALAATALGLLAAIPALIAYNRISSFLNEYNSHLENFSNELYTVISRNLFGDK
jgi:biopolymer transport protein TolQ